MWLTKIKLAIAIATLMVCSCSDKLPTEVVPGPTTVYHGITLVSIPGGSYQRGSNEYEDARPVRTISITPFEMGGYEITNAQYATYLNEALASGVVNVTEYNNGGFYHNQKYWVANDNNVIYMTNNPSTYTYGLQNQCWITYENGCFVVADGKENWPVVNVTWYGAMVFAEHHGLDLPTEAEWEYVCRGRKQLEYGTDDGTISSEKANCYSDSPKEVGSYSANPFGVYDMTGNVLEWCKDWYYEDYYSNSPSQDPKGPNNAPDLSAAKVTRGGYWNFGYFSIPSYRRGSLPPGWGSVECGFRVVRRQ